MITNTGQTYEPRPVCAMEEVTRKSKKSVLEDVEKAHAPMARVQFKQYKIILLDSY